LTIKCSFSDDSIAIRVIVPVLRFYVTFRFYEISVYGYAK